MIQPGALLQNRYRVNKQIGQGGMGTVYLATDERFHSTVAIKQTFFDDPALRKAFEREAHLLNHLRHVALPKVSDHFIEDDGQFLVMDFIEGDDMSELLQQRGAFPLTDVLRWADELLDALDYLHTHEPAVVHRDIKPQNLKLTPRGQVVLLDFGLAKGATTQTRASATASVFGYSRNYAPLEQIQGTGTDPRSDLYSLSATLYHLLTGVPPVDGLTRAGAMVNNQPDPLRPAHYVRAQVPEAIGKILHRAMSQKAALRPHTAAEMRAALRQAANAGSRLTYQAAVTPTQSQSTRYEATVLDQQTQSSDESQAAPAAMLSATRQRRSASPHGETTMVEASADAPRRSAKTYFGQDSATQHRPPVSKPWVKQIGVAALGLLIASVVAFTLTQRTGVTPTNSEVQLKTPLSLAAEGPANSPIVRQEENAGETLNSQLAPETVPSRSQSPAARSAAEASTTSSQPSPVNTEATGATALTTSAGSAGTVESERLSPATGAGATAGRPILEIHSPAPIPTPSVVNSANSETAVRRNTDEPRERPLQPFRPPPDEGRYPPPGGARRPPPRRPPPFP
ncbi:MAG: serine/threonine protein kinase [Pyrinomonadaceae bacterium]